MNLLVTCLPSAPANRQTTTVSDLFLELHHRIEQMEEAVAKKEARKKREKASQY
jgi:hypothetical protein